MATQSIRQRRRVRTFAVIWTFITLVMGIVTFIAIYMVYGIVNTPRNVVTDSDSLALPVVNTPTSVAAVAVVSSPMPTEPPTQVPPTATEQTVAQLPTAVEPTEIPPSPTMLPVDDRHFQAGTQVQVSPDLSPDNQAGWMRDVHDKLHMDWYQAAGPLGRCRTGTGPV